MLLDVDTYFIVQTLLCFEGCWLHFHTSYWTKVCRRLEMFSGRQCLITFSTIVSKTRIPHKLGSCTLSASAIQRLSCVPCPIFTIPRSKSSSWCSKKIFDKLPISDLEYSLLSVRLGFAISLQQFSHIPE